MFAFFGKKPDLNQLASFSVGTKTCPDGAATLIIQVEELSNEGPLVISGPGVRTTHSLGVQGLSREFWNWWQENTAMFPMGMDVILTSDAAFAALARTTKVMEIV